MCAAPRDTTHSIKNCKLCGKEFDPPQGRKIAWMNIVPSRTNPLVHTALCDECYESEGGVWWVGSDIPKYERKVKQNVMEISEDT